MVTLLQFTDYDATRYDNRDMRLMSFLEFEDGGIYGHGPTADKSVPKQRTAAYD